MKTMKTKTVARIAMLLAALCALAGPLHANAAGSEVRLNPAFHPDTQSYTATVPHGMTEVVMDLSAEHSKATVTVNGKAPAAPVRLAVGENTITILVVAEDARYRRTYTVAVTREAAQQPNNQQPPPGPPNTGGGGGLPTPSGSGDEPPPEDEEPSDPDQPDACGENDRENLERFYETTTERGNWDEGENWNSDELLGEWYGVETDEDENVVSLRLSHNALSGDMPAREFLLCFSELKELALWGNDLPGEVPEDFVLAVERAVLRDIAEMLNINPEWFENYEDPYDFEDWHAGVTTDEEGRVVELVLTGEVPGTLISQLRKLRVITTSSEGGGCALRPKDDSSAFSLFLLALLVFAALGRTRARG